MGRDAESGRGGGDSPHRHALIQLALGSSDGRDKQLNRLRAGQEPACASPGGLTGESFLFGGLTIDARIYQYLGIRRLIFAARFLGDLIVGDPPSMSSQALGPLSGFECSRMEWRAGIPEGRFHGRTKIMATTELRASSWVRLFGKIRSEACCSPMQAGFGGTRDVSEQDGEGLGLKWGLG